MKWTIRLLGCLSATTMLLTDYSAADYMWSSIGPTGGFVSSVAFDPSWPGVIWASGDDSDGLYVSTNIGVNWGLLQNVPVDQSTFALTIDPVLHYIYAPNFYGRGMLESFVACSTRWIYEEYFCPVARLSPSSHVRLLE